MKLCDNHHELLVNNKLKKLYEFTDNLIKDEKYRFDKFDISQLKHFFN